LWLGACASPALEAPMTGTALEPADPGAGLSMRATDGDLEADRVEAWTYAILVAEFAVLRSEMEVASEHYLTAARLTREPEVIERALRIALAAEQNDRAVAAARLLTEVQPRRADAFRLLAIALLRKGEVGDAVQALDKVIELDPGNASESFAVAAALLSGEEGRDQAWSAMQALVEHHDKDPEAHLALARLGVRWQRFDDALAAIEQALQRRPDWDEAQLLQAQIFLFKDDTVGATAALAKSVADNPDSIKLRRFYGQLLLERKDYEAAIEQFRILAERDPKNGEVVITLGALYLQQEQNEQASAVFERLLHIDDYSSQANFYLGQVAEVEKRWDEALAHYDQVGKGDQYMDAQIRRAVVLSEMGKLDQGITALERLDTDLPSEMLRLALVRGEILRDAKRLRDAYDAYTEALSQLPENPDLLYARAMVAERMGRVDWLEADLNIVLKNDPEHVQALNALGYTLADRTDRYVEALEYVRRALTLKPEDYYILDSMGWVQYRLGNRDSAIKYLQQAFELKKDIDIAAHLGEVLWVTGQHEEAERVWQQGLKLDGDTSLISETMTRLQGGDGTGVAGASDEAKQ
jgi:tetratricopeptide (TPR) repeat protein